MVVDPKDISIIIGDTHGNEMELFSSNEVSVFHNSPHQFELNNVYQKILTEYKSDSIFIDRLKNYMKEKSIRHDIIDAAVSTYNIDQNLRIYNKANILNKLITKEVGKNVISSYKRASNILANELKNNSIEINNSTDPGLFKNEYEKNLYKKIHEIRKYFINTRKDENYENTLNLMSLAKKEIFEFFENVIVNDEDKLIKKNRLELLQMLCKTFDNYINFSSIES